ncbi:MAG: hypothetical protein NTY96_00290 [Bacteroidetes bacterium]|nr:hypothetical protein [Bacteroidota bacterium]
MKQISLINNRLPDVFIKGLGDDFPSDDYGYTTFTPASDTGGDWWGDNSSGIFNAAGGILKIIDSVISKPSKGKNTYTFPGSQENQDNQNTQYNPQQPTAPTGTSTTTFLILGGIGLAVVAGTVLIIASNKRKSKNKSNEKRKDY